MHWVEMCSVDSRKAHAIISEIGFGSDLYLLTQTGQHKMREQGAGIKRSELFFAQTKLLSSESVDTLSVNQCERKNEYM